MQETSNKPLDEMYNSFGVVIGFVITGLVFAGTPTYLGASKGWGTFWYTLATLFGFFGLLGAMVELGQLKNSEAASRFGVASVCGAIAVVMSAVAHPYGRLAMTMKLIAVVLAAFSGLLIGMGLGSWLEEHSTPQSKEKLKAKGTGMGMERIVSIFVAFLGLATAVVSFMAALHNHK